MRPTKAITIRSDQNLLLANREPETVLRHFCIGVRHFATLDRVGQKGLQSIRSSASNLDHLPWQFLVDCYRLNLSGSFRSTRRLARRPHNLWIILRPQHDYHSSFPSSGLFHGASKVAQVLVPHSLTFTPPKSLKIGFTNLECAFEHGAPCGRIFCRQ